MQKFKNIITEKIKIKIKIWSALLIIPAILIALIGFAIYDFVESIFVTPNNTPQYIYDSLGVESTEELVEAKEDGKGGYYWEFKEGVDEKLSATIENSYKQGGVHNLPNDPEYLKKLIKAELCTQLPDLGGQVPEGSTGFQGCVKIRRVTPNKEIGVLTDVGKGETSAIEKEYVNPNSEMGNSYVEELKTYKEGDSITIKYDAKLYERTKSESGEEIDHWDVMYKEGTESEITIPAGRKVYYTGKYGTSENPLSEINKLTVYVEIQDKESNITAYVKAGNLALNSKEKSNKTASVEVTSRAQNTTKKTIGNSKEKYTIAIAAGCNSTDDIGVRGNGLKEEELTIQVAKEVEKLLEQYTNVEVKQTGSTNNKDVAREDRIKLAEKAKPDLCIQIHFNSSSDGSKSGVETVYKDGDGYSQQLAEILSKNIASSMGLKNLKAGTDIEKCGGNIINIENQAITDFPSVLTKGGFLDNEKDANIIKNEDGIEKYAQGLVNGIEEYFTTSHDGYSSTVVNNEESSASIESIVRNMKYLPMDDFSEKVQNNDSDIISYFSLDEEKKLIIASWSLEDGTVKYEKKDAFDLKTPLQTYFVPYEYLLYFCMDTDYEEFSEDLADVILDSEIVVAVQDNVTTTEQTDTVQNKTEASISDYSKDWSTVSTTTQKTEVCNTSINVTYADTWCVKAYNENSYSTDTLNMGNKDKIVVDIKGSVTKTDSDSTTPEKTITENATGYTGEVDEDGNEITYTYSVYEVTKTHIDTIANQYEAGDSKVEEEESKFVNLYNSHNMSDKVRDGYLFMMIKNNEKTANLLDLTKYLLYKATGGEYGVYEYDFGEFDTDSFEDVNYAMGDFIVKTDEKNASPVLSKEQLQKGIKKWVSGNMQTNALNVLDKVVECQEKYKMNAVFIYALLRQECGIGTANSTWVSENNWMSLTSLGHIQYPSPQDNIDKGCDNIANGSYYFKAGRYSLYEIGEQYCADPPPPAWADEMKEKMIELYEACGITINNGNGASASQGDLLAAADSVAKYLGQKNYTYKGTDIATYTFPIKDNPQRTLSCSSYVQEVLLQAGYTQCAGGEKLYARTDKSKAKSDFKKLGIDVEIIDDINQVQPGDFLQCGTNYHIMMAYSVSGNNVQTKGVPEVLNDHHGFNGRTRTKSELKDLEYYIVRIK